MYCDLSLLFFIRRGNAEKGAKKCSSCKILIEENFMCTLSHSVSHSPPIHTPPFFFILRNLPQS